MIKIENLKIDQRPSGFPLATSFDFNYWQQNLHLLHHRAHPRGSDPYRGQLKRFWWLFSSLEAAWWTQTASDKTQSFQWFSGVQQSVCFVSQHDRDEFKTPELVTELLARRNTAEGSVLSPPVGQKLWWQTTKLNWIYYKTSLFIQTEPIKAAEGRGGQTLESLCSTWGFENYFNYLAGSKQTNLVFVFLSLLLDSWMHFSQYWPEVGTLATG